MVCYVFCVTVLALVDDIYFVEKVVFLCVFIEVFFWVEVVELKNSIRVSVLIGALDSVLPSR